MYDRYAVALCVCVCVGVYVDRNVEKGGGVSLFVREKSMC